MQFICGVVNSRENTQYCNKSLLSYTVVQSTVYGNMENVAYMYVGVLPDSDCTSWQH